MVFTPFMRACMGGKLELMKLFVECALVYDDPEEYVDVTNITDPKAVPVGTTIEIGGLKAKREYNGLPATILSYIPETDRFHVAVHITNGGNGSQPEIKVKPENLRLTLPGNESHDDVTSTSTTLQQMLSSHGRSHLYCFSTDPSVTDEKGRIWQIGAEQNVRRIFLRHRFDIGHVFKGTNPDGATSTRAIELAIDQCHPAAVKYLTEAKLVDARLFNEIARHKSKMKVDGRITDLQIHQEYYID